MATPLVLLLVALVLVGVLVLVAVRRGRVARPGEAREREAAPVSARAEGLAGRIRTLLAGAPGEEAWRRLEELLVRADVGPRTAARIVADLRERHRPGEDPAALLVEEVAALLAGEDVELHLPEGRLGIVLVVGVNGSGKTTTIGKLAAKLSGSGLKVMLAAGDTFRAAASSPSGCGGPASGWRWPGATPTGPPPRSSSRCGPSGPGHSSSRSAAAPTPGR